MILETFKSHRKPVHHLVTSTKTPRIPGPQDIARAIQFKITPAEFIRRDDIVRQMYLDTQLVVGDWCEPHSEAERTKYGKCQVKKLFRTYHDFPTLQAQEWPEDDMPLIVTAEPSIITDDINLILCTPKYLRKLYSGVLNSWQNGGSGC